MGRSQGQVISHAMNGSASHQPRPLSPPSYPPPPTSLRTGLHRQSRSSGELQILRFFMPTKSSSRNITHMYTQHKYLKTTSFYAHWNHFAFVVFISRGQRVDNQRVCAVRPHQRQQHGAHRSFLRRGEEGVGH